MKKKIIGVSAALIVMVCCILLNVMSSNKTISDNRKNVLLDKELDINENEKKEEEEKKNDNTSTKKIAVVYFSATGTTKKVAEIINENVKGTLFEIVPKVQYTNDDLDYKNNDSRSSKESRDSNSRPELKENVNLDSYDVIYLGYPIWNNNVPKIILTLLDKNNLDGKTVIPFCTSDSSTIDTSLNTLKNYKKDIKWVNGKRLTENKDEVKNWVGSIKY